MAAEYRSVATWPPAANWYCGNILAVSRTGWLCWGAKSGLVVARDNEDQQYPTVLTVGDAHSDKVKVTALAWCPEEGGAGPESSQLVSAAEDGVARAWRLEEDQGRLVLVGQAQTGSGRVTSVTWSPADTSLVVLGGETACSLTVWDLMTNSTRTVTVGKQSVFSLAAHPTQADLVAVGCKLGHLLLVNTQGTGRVLARLRGHEEDVYSLAWSPSTTTKLGETEHEEWLLASSSRDRTVRVWSQSEARPVLTLRLPGQDKRRSDHSWISLCWFSPTTLLSAGAGGELLSWQLDVPGRKGGLEYKVLSREHNRNLFTICAHQDKVYTVGQERMVSVTSLSAGKKLYNLPCFAGFVYCLVSNPIEPGVLAVGGGDGAVRVWRTGDTSDMFSVKLVTIRQSKVMSLAWHPTREGLLAAGTDDGKVAWVEVVTSTRHPTVSSYQHRAGVYCLAWLSTKSLLSCGDGKIVQHDLATGKGQELSLGSSQGKSQVVVTDRGDLQLLLVGYEDGSIQVYLHPSLTLLVNIKSQSKLIQSLALHPQYLSDGSQADYSEYLASASNEFPVHIFDLAQIVKGAAESEVATEVLVTPTLSLAGHLQRVIELAWAPHDSRLLCSVSYDWSAQVWDVSTGAPLHNFSGHCGRVMCCLWHPTRPGLVITGSEDTTLHIWDPKDQPRQLPIERKKEKKTKVKESSSAGAVNGAGAGAGGGVPRDSKDLTFDELLALHKSERTKSAEKSPVPEDKRESVETAERGRHFLEARREKKGKTSMKKLYFPLSSQTEAKRRAKTAEDCLSVYQHYQHQNVTEGKDAPVSNGIDGSKDSNIDKNIESHLGFFTSREAMISLLDAELGVQAEDPEARAVLSLWSGDLERVVEAAIRTGTVTERMLSLCAGVSQRLWRRAAVAAGQQCVREGEVSRGADYLLSAGQVLEAVSLLSNNGHHRAAVAIARSRLPLDSEAVRDVMRRWASQCQSDGNYSLAAKCWLSLGETGEASEVLAKLSSSTGDQDCLRLAARLSPDVEKANVYRTQCLAQCLERADQDLALQIIQDDQENLVWCLPLFVTLGHLHRILTGAKEGSQPGALLQNIRSECESRGFDWSSDSRQLTQFTRTNTVRDLKSQSLVQAALLLVSALFTAQTDPQSSLGSVASCLHLLSSRHLLTLQCLTEIFPGGVAGGPPVGLAVLGRELDWQCNWAQLRSILASHAALTINTWASSTADVNQEDLQDVADAVMLDDVIKRQKLSAEIEEGEDAVAKFFVANIESKAESEADKTEEEEVTPPETNTVDLTPSLRGTQTLSLTEDGTWKSEGVSDSVPLSGTEDNPPPPPPPSRSFHDRFLSGRSSNTDALKEIQKLKWTRDKTTAAIGDIPFPDLTEVCKKFLLLMLEKDIGADKTQSETEDDPGYKLSLRKKVARWGYYHGKRCYQEFFIKHS